MKNYTENAVFGPWNENLQSEMGTTRVRKISLVNLHNMHIMLVSKVLVCDQN